MTIHAYAHQLLDGRTSVSRREVCASFTTTDGRGRKVQLIDPKDFRTNRYSGDKKINGYNYVISEAATLGLTVTAFSVLTVAIIIVVYMAAEGSLLGVSMRICALPITLAVIGLTTLAIMGITSCLKQKYLSKELDQDKLKAYLTEIKKHNDFISRSGNQGALARPAEISRQLSELPEVVK